MLANIFVVGSETSFVFVADGLPTRFAFKSVQAFEPIRQNFFAPIFCDAEFKVANAVFGKSCVGCQVLAENFYLLEGGFDGKLCARVAAEIIFAAVTVRKGKSLNVAELKRRGKILTRQSAFVILPAVHGGGKQVELHCKRSFCVNLEKSPENMFQGIECIRMTPKSSEVVFRVKRGIEVAALIFERVGNFGGVVVGIDI